MCDNSSLPSSLKLLDQLRTPGSQLRSQLCVAVSTISRRIAKEQQRALAQIWLPGFTGGGIIALTCAGAPYSIAGEGDLCALFRCVSCRYLFHPTSPDPKQRGSIGRVFLSHRPEICSNISTAPVELYHRVQEAQQCLLHSLCVLPLWMPEITQKAPVAVLEILQPETQPDFESLHELAVFALKDVTMTKATVIEPMPELACTVLNTEQDDDPKPAQPVSPAITFARDCEPSLGFGPPCSDDLIPGAAEAGHMHLMAGDQGAGVQVGRELAGGAGVAGRVVQRGGEGSEGEERMRMVFDNREAAENSDEHLKNVAEAIACRPSAHLSFPKDGVQQADLDVLGIAQSPHPALSNASVCGDAPPGAADDAAGGSPPSGSPPDHITAPHTRHSNGAAVAAGMLDGDVRMLEADVPVKADKYESTAETGAMGTRAMEPGTPNSALDGPQHMEEDMPNRHEGGQDARARHSHEHSGEASYPSSSTPPLATPSGPRPKPPIARPPRTSDPSSRGPSTGGTRAHGASVHSSPEDQVAAAAAAAAGVPTGASAGGAAMNSMIQAIELLNVVQSDTVWQAAEQHGGSLKGGSAALLSALQSQSNEKTVQKVQETILEEDVVEASRARKKRAPTPPTSGQAPMVTEAAERKEPVALGDPSADGTGNSGGLAPAAGAAGAGADPTGAQHKPFAYPGSRGATFVRVSQQPTAGSGDEASGAPAAKAGTLQDKVLRVEAGALGASGGGVAGHPPGYAPAPGQRSSTPGSAATAHGTPHGDPRVVSESGAQQPSSSQVQPQQQQVLPAASAGMLCMSAPHPPMGGVSAAAAAAHAAAAYQDGDVALSAPLGGGARATGGGMWSAVGPGGAAPSTAAVQGGVPAHYTLSQPAMDAAATIAAGQGPGQPPQNGSKGGSTHESAAAAAAAAAEAQALAAAEAHYAPSELKALRNRVNRADGGIGRKLTLDVLKTQFGKGLKEAAESLGMCATTLKRACRRLGVKRWPRTPEAAVQVLAEAEHAQREMAARKSTQAPFGAPWESWPGMQPPSGSGAPPGMPALPPGAPGPGSLVVAGMGMPDGLLPGGKSAGYDEFDDFLDMLEVGE